MMNACSVSSRDCNHFLAMLIVFLCHAHLAMFVAMGTSCDMDCLVVVPTKAADLAAFIFV